MCKQKDKKFLTGVSYFSRLWGVVLFPICLSERERAADGKSMCEMSCTEEVKESQFVGTQV